MTDHPIPALTPEGERAFAQMRNQQRRGWQPCPAAHGDALMAEIQALHAVLRVMSKHCPGVVPTTDGWVADGGYACTMCGAEDREGREIVHNDITNGYGCPAEFIERLYTFKENQWL